MTLEVPRSSDRVIFRGLETYTTYELCTDTLITTYLLLSSHTGPKFCITKAQKPKQTKINLFNRREYENIKLFISVQ